MATPVAVVAAVVVVLAACRKVIKCRAWRRLRVVLQALAEMAETGTVLELVRMEPSARLVPQELAGVAVVLEAVEAEVEPEPQAALAAEAATAARVQPA